MVVESELCVTGLLRLGVPVGCPFSGSGVIGEIGLSLSLFVPLVETAETADTGLGFDAEGTGGTELMRPMLRDEWSALVGRCSLDSGVGVTERMLSCIAHLSCSSSLG